MFNVYELFKIEIGIIFPNKDYYDYIYVLNKLSLHVDLPFI